MATSVTKTTCPYCGVGCGVIATVEASGTITIQGDPDHPANQGRLCSKGTALAETLGMEGRLLQPEVDGKVVAWSSALDTVASRLQETIQQHGPDAVAFYLSGQLLTEDYYVANKLMKGFIGSANVDTNSRLCMSSAVAAYKRAFGSDTVPCNYEDIDQAQLITLVGSNTAWCHPVLYQRIVKAKKVNPDLKVVVIDPRKTATSEIADLHLPLQAGSDGHLFCGLLSYLDQHGHEQAQFTRNHCEGVDSAIRAAMSATPSLTTVTTACSLDREQIEQFYRWFAESERALTLFSQGVNQSTSGTDKGNAIINCHLFTGRIGKPGMGPFSLTGQPNAMGGREVGGLANQLAAHMEIENPQHHALVSEFWDAPKLCTTPGLKATELFSAIEQGTIKAVWIMATNPAVSLPDSEQVRKALKQCPLVVVSDCVAESDTLELADIKLPATTWGEKSGTVTNSERTISRQRPFMAPPGEALPDWKIVCEVARRMGFGNHFHYDSPHEIFTEHAALSGYRNEGSRDLDLISLSKLNPASYEALSPTQWPQQQRPFAEGRFFTPSGRAQLIAVTPQLPEFITKPCNPLLLNSGRSRDQWHTMTRTGRSSRLSQHAAEPYVELSTEDAHHYGVERDDLVTLKNHLGRITVRAKVGSTPPGSLFTPIHWSDSTSSAGRVNSLVEHNVDPHSGQPAFKQSLVTLAAYSASWYGFILSRRPLRLDGCGYWSRSRGKGVWRYQIAGESSTENWGTQSRSWLCADQQQVGWVEYFDSARSHYRAARIVNDQLDSCIYIGPNRTLPAQEWIEPVFTRDQLAANERSALLSGKPLQAGEDRGKTICACFGVGKREIEQLIEQRQITNVEEITRHLKAGGNCGSCLPELKQML